MFAVSLFSGTAFIISQLKLKEPMLNLSVFKNKLFSLSIFCGFITFVTIFCNNIVMPFYLQDAMKFSSAYSGIILMVNPLVMSVVAPLSGTLSDKIGSEFLTFIGLIIVSLGTFLLSTLTLDCSILPIVIYLALTAFGMGLFQSPNNSLIMSTVKKTELGIAGSINALVRNIGMSCGIVIATNLLYSMMSVKLNTRITDFVPTRPDAFIFGMKIVYLTAAAICFFGALLTLLRLISAKKKAD
jgi:MFS family permease